MFFDGNRCHRALRQGELHELHRQHREHVAVQQYHDQAQSRLRLRDKTGWRQTMLLEQSAELVVGDMRDAGRNPLCRRQILERRDFLRLRERMSQTTCDDTGVVEELLHDQAFRHGAVRPRPDIEIHATVLQAGFQGRKEPLDDTKTDVRIASSEAPQRLRQERDMRRDREPRNERSADASLNLTDLLPRAPHVAEYRVGSADEYFADRRGRDASRPSLEKRDPELVLQFMDASRQRRLRQTETAGRRPDAPLLGDSRNIAKLVQFHTSNIRRYQIFIKNASSLSKYYLSRCVRVCRSGTSRRRRQRHRAPTYQSTSLLSRPAHADGHLAACNAPTSAEASASRRCPIAKASTSAG